MKPKWTFFLGAAALAAYFLIANGMPLFPVLAGCGLAGLVTWWKLSRQTAPTR